MHALWIRASLFLFALPFLSQAGWSQTVPSPKAAIDCGLYEAAIREMSDTSPVLVIDSSAADVPWFAFNAISHPRSLADQGMHLPDSVLQALKTANDHRQPLGGCLRSLSRVQPISDSTLQGVFAGHDHRGWDRFHQRYKGIKRFILVSVPMLLADSLALVYVAYASDWLNGEGVLLQLQRKADGHWIKKSSATVWIS